MGSAGAGPRFDVRIGDEVLNEDFARYTLAARESIEPTLATVRKEGVPRDWLRRCEEEGRDGTRLGGCVKFYVPPPAGRWGAVLAADEKAAKVVLVWSRLASGIQPGLGSRASTRSPIAASKCESADQVAAVGLEGGLEGA